MNIGPDETDLVGSWIFDSGRTVGDAIEERITQLISRHLERIAASAESGGWNTLYRDPDDGRLWELTYPQSGMHGGGPMRLTQIAADLAVSKYPDGSGFLNL
jgi:hypothetical protein